MRTARARSAHCAATEPAATAAQICLGPMETSTLPCGHTMHSSCLETWVSEGNENCPLCKAPVTLEEVIRNRKGEGTSPAKPAEESIIAKLMKHAASGGASKQGKAGKRAAAGAAVGKQTKKPRTRAADAAGAAAEE